MGANALARVALVQALEHAVAAGLAEGDVALVRVAVDTLARLAIAPRGTPGGAP